MRVLISFACLLPLAAAAGPQQRQKQAQVRAESQDLVDAILHGEGNLNVTLNRVQYLGQQGSVSLELPLQRAEPLPQCVDVEERLAGMLVLAVPGVDHRGLAPASDELGGASVG